MANDDYDKFLDSPSPTALDDLHDAVSKMRDAAAEVMRLEAQLERAQSTFKHYQQHLVPELMDALRMKEFKRDDGALVQVDTTYVGSLPKEPEKRAEALAWLEQNGYGSLVKNKFVVEYGRSESAWADRLDDQLKKLGVDAERTSDVHHKTLGALVRQLMEEGVEMPEMFKATKLRVAKVK
jgi:SOS response regulatory protein OraA/RecX